MITHPTIIKYETQNHRFMLSFIFLIIFWPIVILSFINRRKIRERNLMKPYCNSQVPLLLLSMNLVRSSNNNNSKSNNSNNNIINFTIGRGKRMKRQNKMKEALLIFQPTRNWFEWERQKWRRERERVDFLVKSRF